MESCIGRSGDHSELLDLIVCDSNHVALPVEQRLEVLDVVASLEKGLFGDGHQRMELVPQRAVFLLG